ADPHQHVESGGRRRPSARRGERVQGGHARRLPREPRRDRAPDGACPWARLCHAPPRRRHLQRRHRRRAAREGPAALALRAVAGRLPREARDVHGAAEPVGRHDRRLQARTLRLTSRRVETPAIRRSPGLRARTKNGWFPCGTSGSRNVGRITNVTQPSAPVACSRGVVVLPNGMPTTNTSAPWTGWFWLSVTWNRAVNALCEVRSAGMNCSRSITSLFGSETSLIEIVW